MFPISSPSAPQAKSTGQNAFLAYLGADKKAWEHYDASYLITHARIKTPILVYQGESDHLLEENLKPEKLTEAAQKNDYPFTPHMKAGYDHSHYFVTTLIGDHLKYHAEILRD